MSNRRCLAFGAAGALFLVVTLLRWNFDRAGEAVALLYVVPIALVALVCGRRAGVLSAALGAGAFSVLEAVRASGDLDLTGWLAPVLAMALVGVLVGHLADEVRGHRRLAAAEARRSRHLEELCKTQHAALVASDSMLQDVAAARWMLESGSVDRAIDVIGVTVSDTIRQLSNALELLPDQLGDPGQAEGSAGHPAAG